MASQITSHTIACSTVYSGTDESSASLAYVRGIHHDRYTFLAQLASNAENVSIWWRHHQIGVLHECDCLASNDHLQITKEKVRSKNMISHPERHQLYMVHTDFIFQNLSMKMAWSWVVFQIRNINKIERVSTCLVKKIALHSIAGLGYGLHTQFAKGI